VPLWTSPGGRLRAGWPSATVSPPNRVVPVVPIHPHPAGPRVCTETSLLAPYVAAAESSFVTAARACGLVAEVFVLLGLLFSFLLPIPVGAPGEAGRVLGDPEDLVPTTA